MGGKMGGGKKEILAGVVSLIDSNKRCMRVFEK